MAGNCSDSIKKARLDNGNGVIDYILNREYHSPRQLLAEKAIGEGNALLIYPMSQTLKFGMTHVSKEMLSVLYFGFSITGIARSAVPGWVCCGVSGIPSGGGTSSMSLV